MLFHCLWTNLLAKLLTRYYDIKVGSGAQAVKGSRVAVSNYTDSGILDIV